MIKRLSKKKLIFEILLEDTRLVKITEEDG